MAARKKKNLVIVESPAKAKTIQKYLGPDFQVEASKGHVRDLPKSTRGGIGVDIEAGWVPTYKILEDRKEQLAALKKVADKAAAVYLATDPDREGEAIAWHLKEALGLPDDITRRVTFNEITKRAIQEAFAHPSGINMDRVAAQEARRFLDRVVGYKLSPLLARKVTRGLSAGRVQSVAVRLIVDREHEIEQFKPEEYWQIHAVLAPAGTVAKPKRAVSKVRPTKKKKADDKAPTEASENGQTEAPSALPEVPPGAFLAELVEWQGQKFKAANEQEAKAVVAALEGAAYVVSKVEQKDRLERPQPPFITSTLQQQASLRLHYSTKKTMMLAQRLYEGVDLGSEGSVALITYMRTDSTRISDDALKMVREHIEQTYGKPYLPEQPNRYASGKSAQEAHEAIRPTDLAYTPQRVAELLPPRTEHRQELIRLYTLIYNRFVASQMTPAVFAVTNVEVTARGEPGASATGVGLFKAQGKVLKFDGYRRVLPPAGKQEDTLLPPLKEEQPLDLLNLVPSQHFTQPPPRYNEASLVKALEKEGIGRPSTYAEIISKIQKRGYVVQKDRRFYATEVGKTVTQLLVDHFPKIMDLKFTSHMEEELDEIEEGKIERNAVLEEFWQPFQQALAQAESAMPAMKGIETGEKCPECAKPLVVRFSKKTGRKFIGCSGWPECKYIKPGEDEEGRPAPMTTEHACPTCGKPMLQRMGPRGPFLGCSGYPECKTTMNLDAEGKPMLSARPTEHVCDKCGRPMVLREGRRGPFLACTGYPECKNAKDVDAEGNPVEPIDTGIECEKCGAPMIVRRGPRGPFLGCSKYPKCRSTRQVPAELKEKVKALLPAKKAPAVEVNETCPECGATMKLRRGPRGYFLGCSKYPKCKGTREATPELLEQVQGSPA
ncbi:MAG TPA: type I DNA topoisomerase [Gemmataceae bacterium]|nr:type I DNA topoisomerase [Gemmataceae bacterium]